ncbi:MAG: hypothetical protein Q9212_002087 [Teloschistes hypoglaucus]
MEKPDAPQLPLTILHHDEHILFPGYDAMVGNGGPGYHEKNGPSPWTAGNLKDRAELSNHGRDGIHRSWYKRHRMKLVVATILCDLLRISNSSHLARVSPYTKSCLLNIVRSSILLALVGLVAYISARPSPEAGTAASFEGIATFNDYNSQLETQGSTVCGGNSIPGWSNIDGGSILELSVIEGFLTGGQR